VSVPAALVRRPGAGARTRRFALAARWGAFVVVGITLASCGRSQKPGPVPRAYLFEKGPYQGVYGPDGKMLRLLYDANGDKRADVVTLFHPNGAPRQAEIDTDFDGVVDRWQYFSTTGALEREGWARRRPGTVDTWEYRSADGSPFRREIDEDGNGSVDRTETFFERKLVGVAMDSDRNGRVDRWQRWHNGRLLQEEIDTDGDGIPDRRLRYGASGDVAGFEIIWPPARTASASPRPSR
jgi:hypothetical protein